MINLTQYPVWHTLCQHQQTVAPLHMRDLFAADKQRFEHFSLQFDDLLLDYSKHRITHVFPQIVIVLMSLQIPNDDPVWVIKVLGRHLGMPARISVCFESEACDRHRLL